MIEKLLLPVVFFSAACLVAAGAFAGGLPGIMDSPPALEKAPGPEEQPIPPEAEETVEPEFELPAVDAEEFAAPSGPEPAGERTGRLWIPAVLLGAAVAAVIFLKLLKTGS